MVSEAGGEQLRGTGARLRDARERKGLKLLEVAERLHTDGRILEALEADDYAPLGADVYVRGHLRRYAEFLGESPAALPALYGGGALASRPDLTRIPHEPGGTATRRVAPALLGLAAFALVALLWRLVTVPGEKPQPLTGSVPTVPEAGAPAAGPVAGTAATAAPGALERSASSAGAPSAQTQITLRFSGLSWVEVSDTTGRHLLEGLYAQDSTRTLSGAPPLRVTLGNAPAVSLQVNGAPVRLAGLERRDGSARVLIDSDGRASAAPPRLAHGD
jgi:cytoskeleton protein RodZ